MPCREMAELHEQLGSRSFFTFYEKLKLDFEGEIQRLAAFLGVPLSEEKFEALARHVSGLPKL